MVLPTWARLAFIATGGLLLFSCAGPATFTVPETQRKIGNLGFVIDIPIPGGQIDSRFPGNGVVNYDFYLDKQEFKPAKLYSVEWISRKDQRHLGDVEVDKYLEDFIPEYLRKNFGDGNYTLLLSKQIILNNKYAGKLFVGSGHHNGGEAGSIYLISIYFDHHWAMIYSLNANTIEKSSPFLQAPESVAGLPAFEKFWGFANSFDLAK